MENNQRLKRQRVLDQLRELYDLEIDEHGNVDFWSKETKQKLTAKQVAVEIGMGSSQFSTAMNPSNEGSLYTLSRRVEITLAAKKAEYYRKRFRLAKAGVLMLGTTVVLLIMLLLGGSDKGQPDITSPSSQYISKGDYDKLQALHMRMLNYSVAAEVVIFAANVRQGKIREENIDDGWNALASRVMGIIRDSRQELHKMDYLAPNGENISQLFELGYEPYGVERFVEESFSNRRADVLDSELGYAEIMKRVIEESRTIQQVTIDRIDSLWIEMEAQTAIKD